MRYITITSARKNPLKNKKINYRKILEKYKGKNYYVSFQNITKLGINPNSRDNHTPMGVYVFPLDYIYTNDFVKTVHIKFQDAPYVFVVKANTNKILNLNKDLLDKKQIEKVTEYFNAPNDHNHNSYYYHEFKKMKLQGDTCTTAGDLYIYTCYLASNAHRWNKKHIPDSRLMNHVFRHLGYEFIIDNGGSIISHYEPTQAVFLVKNAYKIITMENTYQIKKVTSWAEVNYRGVRFNDKNKRCVFFLDALNSIRNKPLINKLYNFKLEFPTKDEVHSLYMVDGLKVPNTKYGREYAITFLTLFLNYLDKKDVRRIIKYLVIQDINKNSSQDEIEKMLPSWLKKHHLDKINLDIIELAKDISISLKFNSSF